MEKQSLNNTIAVIGQGYVGLPLSLSFALHGVNVIGVDSDANVCEQLSQGITYQSESWQGQDIQTILRAQLQSGRYQITSDGASAVSRAQVIILTVGIPVDDGKPVFTHFESACKTIGANLQKGSLILIRSTVVPGTTEGFCVPLLESLSGFRAGRDFFVAYIPERIAEGKAFEEFETMPTLIGAADQVTIDKATDVIRINSWAEITPSFSVISVETSKVLENLQRDANIAMVQEFARFAEAAGMNALEVIRLANTHARVNLLSPGPGVGGYCIPNAFHYLNAKAAELGVSLPLLQLAREMNAELPQLFADKTEELLKATGRTIQSAKIAVAGLAMKDCSPDDRLSPAVEICKALLAKGASVAAYDPNVAASYPFKVDSFEAAVAGADALLLLNKLAAGFDPQPFLARMNPRPVILDTRELLRREALPTDAVFWQI